MTRISSDWTLFYKIFLPNVWIVFFGVVVGFVLFSFKPHLPFLIGTLLFYLGGIGVLYITLMTLKRVEGTDEHLYITNYFKTFRYTFESIDRIRTFDLIILKIVTLYFFENTSFGKRVIFIRRKAVWEEYVQAHPRLAKVAMT